MLVLWLNTSCRVDDIHSIEACSRTSVGYCRGLGWLSLSIKESTHEAVVVPVTDRRARVPKLLGVGLVSYVLEHTGDLPIFDLKEYGSAKLEVVTLLVD